MIINKTGKIKIDPEIIKEFESIPFRKAYNAYNWTPEKEELLLLYWKSGRNQKEMAAKFGMGRDACRKKYNKLIKCK